MDLSISLGVYSLVRSLSSIKIYYRENSRFFLHLLLPGPVSLDVKQQGVSRVLYQPLHVADGEVEHDLEEERDIGTKK